MSLPKQPPSHSSSPTKPSLRRPSGPQAQPTPRALLPSPHFEEPPLILHSPYRSPPQAHIDYEEAIDEGQSTVELSNPVSATFRPFFTLIHDTATSTHHHPTVHYIFADDDTDIITEAACRALAQDDPSMGVPFIPQKDPRRDKTSGSKSYDKEEVEESKLPSAIPGVREHYLLLDVQPSEPDGGISGVVGSGRGGGGGGGGGGRVSYEVTAAHSLSSEWQILETRITNAPTITDAIAGSADDEAEGEEDGLMLKIEGRGATATPQPPPLLPPPSNGGTQKGAAKKDKETMDEMVERFEKGLADIRRTIELGDNLLGGGEGDETTTTSTAEGVLPTEGADFGA